MSLQLAIVMPAYNEEGCMADVVKIWTELLAKDFAEEDAKLIVVNDGSKDKTAQILDQLAKENSRLVVVHQPNGGHGVAVVRAYQEAVDRQAAYVFQTDSDDQFEVSDFQTLWNKRNQSKFILGWRQVRHDAPFRLLITRILKYSLFFIYGTYLEDANIPFRLIEGNFLKKLLTQLPKSLPFAPNIFIAVMAKKAKQELYNVPITHKERATGEVSIVKMKLLKVCWISFKELLRFRVELNSKVRQLLK
jgi:dolichol-phosphate mannosyltransferase